MIGTITEQIFYGFFVASKLGKTGLTVTVDVYGESGILVSGASATEIAGGLYKYAYTPASAGNYIAIFKTADTSVDQQEIPSLWVIEPEWVETIDDLTTDLATVDGIVDSILEDTAPLGAAVTTIDGIVDSILADTAPLDAELTTIEGKIDDLDTDIYDLTHVDGEEVPRVIPAPESANTCVLYEYCYAQDGATPLSSVTATAVIIHLPYDYSDKLHTGAEITGTYDAIQGLVTWEIVYGAAVTIKIDEVGFQGSVTVPSQTQARVSDL